MASKKVHLLRCATFLFIAAHVLCASFIETLSLAMLAYLHSLALSFFLCHHFYSFLIDIYN